MKPGRFVRAVTVLAGAALLLSVATAAGATRGAHPALAGAPGSELEQCGASGVQFAGFSDALNKTSFGGFAVSELSGLAYDRASNTYRAVADRAGAVPTHVFSVTIPAANLAAGVPAVQGVTVLNAAPGVPFTGFTFDGEGIAMDRDGAMVIASESGSAAGEQPEIRRFGSDGMQLDEMAVAAKFIIGPNNLSFESLSISPNGHSLFTANEAPLAADGRTGDLRSRIRIVRYEDRGPDGFAPAQEYFYLTEPGRTTGDLGVAEIMALSEKDVLVLERGFVAGQGNTIRIFHTSLKHGDDVSAVESLAASGLEPVSKTLLVDLATCPDGGATIPPGATQPNALLDNFEAMTLGPKLPGGRRALILMSDDNGGTNQTTRIVVLAVPQRMLVGQDN
jgi:hypothetical protein